MALPIPCPDMTESKMVVWVDDWAEETAALGMGEGEELTTELLLLCWGMVGLARLMAADLILDWPALFEVIIELLQPKLLL